MTSFAFKRTAARLRVVRGLNELSSVLEAMGTPNPHRLVDLLDLRREYWEQVQKLDQMIAQWHRLECAARGGRHLKVLANKAMKPPGR